MVAQLVEAPCYWLEGCGFDFQLGRWIFHFLNPSCHTVSLRSTQPLKEISTRGYFVVGKGG